MRLKLIEYGQRVYHTIEWLRQRRWIQIVINVFLFLVMVIFIGLYIFQDWDQLSQLRIVVNFRLIAISFIFYGVNYLLFSISWHILFRAYNPKVRWWDNLLFYSYSYIMRFLPTPFWFIASRAVLYEKVGTRKRIALLTTFLETYLHFISGLSFYCLLIIDFQKPLTSLPFILSLMPVVIAILRPSLFQHQVITGGKSTIELFRPKDAAVILTLFIFTWLIAAPFFSLLIRSVIPDMILPLTDIWKVWILSSLVSYLSMYTLGGVGMLREFSMTLLLNNWFSPPVALIITVLLRIVMTIAGIFWALITIGSIRLFKVFHKPEPIISSD